MAAVSLVLLVACANVANLLFVRGQARRGELAVRAALGAGRGRMVRQLLTEVLVYGALGGTLGAGLGVLGLELLLATCADVLPDGFAATIDVNARVLAFTASLALATSLAAGLIPSHRSTRTNIADVLSDGATKASRRRGGRDLLIGSEMAFSMILMVGAGLLIQSLVELQNTERGFDGEDVLTLRVQVPRGRYGDRDSWIGFLDRVRTAVGATPSVTEVASSNHFPLSGTSWEMLYRDEATPPGDRGESVLLTMVSPSFFRTYGVEIVAGRPLADSDRWDGDLVAVVDETLASARWPGDSPLGKRVTFETVPGPDDTSDREPVWRTVVGVARNVRHYELRSPSRIQVYTPIDQSVAWGFTSYVSVASDGDPAALVPGVRAAIAAADAEAALYRIRPMRDVLDEEFGTVRAMRELLTIFAAVTLLLGCVGIFSVVSYTTAHRNREIGIRLALGGSPATMLRIVLGESLVPVIGGLVVGGIAAAVLGRTLGALLYEVTPTDPLVLTGSALLLLVVAAFSAWLPARRAVSSAPRSVLGDE